MYKLRQFAYNKSQIIKRVRAAAVGGTFPGTSALHQGGDPLHACLRLMSGPLQHAGKSNARKHQRS